MLLGLPIDRSLLLLVWLFRILDGRLPGHIDKQFGFLLALGLMDIFKLRSSPWMDRCYARLPTLSGRLFINDDKRALECLSLFTFPRRRESFQHSEPLLERRMSQLLRILQLLVECRCTKRRMGRSFTRKHSLNSSRFIVNLLCKLSVIYE